jgi:small-conductance mechanosensitive channel
MDTVWQIWDKIYQPLILIIAALAAALIADFILFRILRRMSRRIVSLPEDSIARHCRPSARPLLVTIAIRLVLPLLNLPPEITGPLIHIILILLIALASYLLIKLICVLEDYVLKRFDIAEKDNLRARKVYTQMRVFKRITTVVVGILAFGFILMTFPKVQQIGTTILASAGIAGLVIGMAAQRTIGTFIAGLQIAITQPIRLDDVVIVENEWGRIEEIALTYVVVKIWDLRRLVVPITYFIEKPFQNWTRTTADLLGTIYIYVDYTVPIDEIRSQLRKIVEQAELWDGRVCGLQVTNTTERTVELRALVSAADASKAWDLRCLVREKLITFIQKSYPGALPKLRAEFEGKSR